MKRDLKAIPVGAKDVTSEQKLKEIAILEQKIRQAGNVPSYPKLGMEVALHLKKKALQPLRRRESAKLSPLGVNRTLQIPSHLFRPRRYTSSNTKPSYLGYALYHYYWHKHTQNPSIRITEFTCERIAREHGISSRQLWKYGAPMLDGEPKPRKKGVSFQEYAKQYRLILPMLKEVCPKAYEDVEGKLTAIKAEKPHLIL